MLPTTIWEDKAKDLFRLRVHSDASCDFGGRSRSKIMKLLLKVEAAGIEPGHFDDLGAVSLRHLAPVRDSPREMGGPRALSRVANRHPAGSVDQRDHGGPEKVPISLKGGATNATGTAYRRRWRRPPSARRANGESLSTTFLNS